MYPKLEIGFAKPIERSLEAIFSQHYLTCGRRGKMVFKLLEGDTITPDGDKAKTFGVIVLPDSASKTTNSHSLYQNYDVTFNHSQMLSHIKLWNELQPSLQQLEDLIADLIESNYNMP